MKLDKIDYAVLSHWVDNLKFAIKYYRSSHLKYFHRISLRASDCNYCLEYFHDDCFNCPIYQFTGLKCCGCTPYERIEKLQNQILKNQVKYSESDEMLAKHTIYDLVCAIAEEYMFLKKVYGMKKETR